ncbi:MAG: CRISPR-associated protein Csx11 [Deltaproteobacteria bacterium]|nr:CRISPR-associated protein Csx11 [Deltaproteobacteria bacterium]
MNITEHLKNHDHILFIELAGLLHDIGKLSKVFLEYRKTWRGDLDPLSYYKDPHDNRFLDHEEKGIIPHDFFKPINELLNGGVASAWDPCFSISKAINLHTEKEATLILQMLKAADGNDSALDRNNPLWEGEQKEKIFQSNVFGYEKNNPLILDEQDALRKELYTQLGEILPNYLKTFGEGERRIILDKIKISFERGLADTACPQNDTTLWEHSYAVASILKVIAVHNLFYDKHDKQFIKEYDDVRFGILGIGWDGLRFISYGQRIGDLVGRQQVIEKVKANIRNLIEHKYFIGNEIYTDIDGSYFIVPADFDTEDRYTELKITMLDEIYSEAAHISKGELQPHIAWHGNTNALTSLVTVRKQIQGHIRVPFDASNSSRFYHFSDLLDRYTSAKTVCPICRLRPIEKEDTKKKICHICEERRIAKPTSKKDPGLPEETLFLDEIIDNASGKACLIVARFGLDRWLDGSMIRTLFVAPSKALEREVEGLAEYLQFGKDELEIKQFLKEKGYGNFNYSRIKDDIDALYLSSDRERARHTSFLYYRRDKFIPNDKELSDIKLKWERMFDDAKKETGCSDQSLLYNIITAKTPTPSTILDVWDTTLNFFNDFAKSFPSDHELNIPERQRLRLAISSEFDVVKKGIPGGTIDARVVETNKAVEIIFIDNKSIEVIGEVFQDDAKEFWGGKILEITDKENPLYQKYFRVESCLEGTLYRPCRTVAISPTLFMALVPATKALKITTMLYDAYQKNFSKVMGRLPFSVGNVFFKSAMPMFVVLDAGKRMISQFDQLAAGTALSVSALKANNDSNRSVMQIDANVGCLERNITWKIPVALQSGSCDFYHPYCFIEESDDSIKDTRDTAFKTYMGKVIHWSEINVGDRLKIHPNYYDFEFLDANTRRHDIALSGNRRKSAVMNSATKPFLLEELEQRIVYLWDKILKGNASPEIKDTKLRNVQSLLLSKYNEWNVQLAEKDSSEYNEWMALVRTCLKKEFPLPGQEMEAITEMIENGLFFETLEMYFGIMKEKLGKEK